MSTGSIAVIIASRGVRPSLRQALDALAGQSLPADRFDVRVVIDGWETSVPSPDLGVPTSTVTGAARGPGAARNHGAALASGEWLAFTDDDCVPEPDWLERAAQRIRDSGATIIQGRTLEAGGASLMRFEDEDSPGAITTNLFVRRADFVAAGGFDEAFADPERDLYFREDTDLVLRLLDSGARQVFAPEVRVTHAALFADAGSPLRHARRHEFDALLQRRHPQAFHRSLEVKRIGPWRVHRPFHWASLATLTAWIAAALLLVTGHGRVAALLAALALVGHAVAALRYARAGSRAAYWAGWATPFVYVAALTRGCLRHGGWGVWR